MNEVSHYQSEDYHLNQALSVLVHLEGTTLRLQTPKHNIPRRAMWSESNYTTAAFIHQRHYDMRNAYVMLLPQGLVKKRLWSKKYPICIVLPAQASKTAGLKNLDISGAAAGVLDDDDGMDIPTETRLYLFGRTCRDKEEWFYRFLAASQNAPLPLRITDLLLHQPSPCYKPLPTPASVPELTHQRGPSTDSNISDLGHESSPDLSSKPEVSHESRLRDYLHYMARAIPTDSMHRSQQQAAKDEQRRGSGRMTPILPCPVRCEPQLAWVNAMVFRLFWDFLREKFWVEKIRTKIQNKLNKMHVSCTNVCDLMIFAIREVLEKDCIYMQLLYICML